MAGLATMYAIAHDLNQTDKNFSANPMFTANQREGYYARSYYTHYHCKSNFMFHIANLFVFDLTVSVFIH